MKFNVVLKQTDESRRIQKAALLILHISDKLHFGKGLKKKCRTILVNYLAALDGLVKPNEEVLQSLQDRLFVQQECACLDWD
jgi:hypothetical protein